MIKATIITLFITSGGVEIPVDSWKPQSAMEFAIQYNDCKEAGARAENVRYVGLYGARVQNGLNPKCVVTEEK